MDNTEEIVNKCFEAVQAKMIPKDYINTDFLMEHGIKGIWEEAINTALIAIKHANDNNDEKRDKIEHVEIDRCGDGTLMSIKVYFDVVPELGS